MTNPGNEKHTRQDLIILGGGPGGYVAAIRAAQLGLTVTVVEKDKALGGTCLHRGCIPTKALLHYTETVERLAHCADFGLNVTVDSLDLKKMHSAKSAVVDRMAKGISALMKANAVTVVRGTGRLVGPGRVDVDGNVLEAKNVLLATGSRPATLPFLKPDSRTVFSSDEILAFDGKPKSMVVLGAGAVGLEFACIYQALGCEVQVIEMVDRALPLEDEEVSAAIQASFKKRGIPIHCSVQVASADISEHGAVLQAKSLLDSKPLTFKAETVLCAVGRVPVLDGLNLEAFDVERDGRYLKVDSAYRTNLDWLYAIGDIVPGPQLAHVASAEGIVCAEGLAAHPTFPIDYQKIPSATYCRPEVASVGLTEQQAKDRDFKVVTSKFPWAALGKAAIIGETDGFVKIVADAQYGELLGVHIVGPHATDLIAEACVALNCEATVEELFRTVHAHPTLPEGLMEAAHGIFSTPIHLPPQRSRRRQP